MEDLHYHSSDATLFLIRPHVLGSFREHLATREEFLTLVGKR